MEAADGKHHGDGLFLSGGRRLRAVVDLDGESCCCQIDAGVRTAGGEYDLWQDLGGGDARTRVNRAGGRGGSGRPELEKKASPRPSGVLGGAMGVGGEVPEW